VHDHARGLTLAFELTDFGIRIRAQRFRREHPGASEEDVEAFIQSWFLARPGAPDGDAVGRPRPVPAA
jgi:hypothetical protein